MLKLFVDASWVHIPCISDGFQIDISLPADNFEIASLPTTSPEERRKLLSFVVCGGGPTGVETAAVSTPFVLLEIF
jgi:NADH dehydrogenase